MLNSLPFVGWFLSLLFNISLAIPFWICWTWAELGERYFYFLPAIYQSVPFWHVVGVFIILSILQGVLVPKFASVSVEQKNQ